MLCKYLKITFCKLLFLLPFDESRWKSYNDDTMNMHFWYKFLHNLEVIFSNLTIIFIDLRTKSLNMDKSSRSTNVSLTTVARCGVRMSSRTLLLFIVLCVEIRFFTHAHHLVHNRKNPIWRCLSNCPKIKCSLFLFHKTIELIEYVLSILFLQPAFIIIVALWYRICIKNIWFI